MHNLICRICSASKPISEFYKDAAKKHGVRSLCKDCDKARSLQWAKDNPASINARNALWQKKNRANARARCQKWRASHVDHDRNRKLEWSKANPHKRIEYNAKQRSTPKGKVEQSVRRAINHSIVKGSKMGKPTFEILGYSSEQLKAHLEALFIDGMNWENYGRNGWHIDHIIPLAAFNYSTPDHIDFKRAWALSNLQPLWQADNIRKHAKLNAPFQPSLAI